MVIKSSIKFILPFLFFLICSNQGFTQDNNPWTQKPIPSDINTISGNGNILGYYTLDFKKLKSILATSTEVKFPSTDGKLTLFKVLKSKSLSPDLEAKYPGIGTYFGTIEGKSKLNFTINSFGLLGKVIIEDKVYTLKSVGNSNYILTFIEAETSPIDDDEPINQFSASISNSNFRSSSVTADLGPPSTITSLKVYRLAVIPTAEYSNHFVELYGAENATLAEKREIVISAIEQTIATVNTITLRDLGIKFELVLNNDKLIEFNTLNDKLTHGNKMTLLGEAAKVINSKIGINSYDLGHVFDASSFGGVANLSVLCSSIKANGVTGSSSPEIGDYFPAVVAHEIGHQLGALHTFNSNVGVGTNRVETGAGITIMGYGSMELFYHAKSILEMNSHISTTSCAVIRSNSNTAPSYLISPLSTVYTIPAGTPFVLGDKFSFRDTQNDILSYNWDQMDAQATSNPPLPTSNVGPSFITYYPKEDLVRYFPKLETVLSGSTASTWEVVPQVSRDLNFTLNIRESNAIAPILVQENFKVTTLNNGSGPFIVTSQGVSGIKYKQGDEITVNWNESSSKSSAINTQNVKISLSYDGGLTFSHVLKETTPNDGSEKVILPILANTTRARIKVEPVNNIYYAINSINFEITNPPFVFNMNTPSLVRCFGEQESKITINPSGGGGAPYTISWFKNNNTVYQTVSDSDSDPKTLINLGVGKYKVRVTDKDSIEYEQEVTIIGPTSPLLVSNVVANTKSVFCFGESTGQIALQASGGSAPYKYILNGTEVASNRGDSTLDTDSYLISNLSAGSYTIRIIDANNCISEPITVVINGPSSPLSVSSSVITNTTLSNSNGAISITISGGTVPYNYSWTGPNSYSSTNQNISTLANGLYKLRVTDARGCILESNFTVESQDTFNYNITQTNVSCKGGSNGSLSTFPSGGNGGPYQVTWTGPNGFTSTNFSIRNLVAGVYELRIKDNLGASFDLKSITITEPQNALAISSSFLNHVACTGDSTGSFGLNISGGTAPYSYSVNGIFSKTSGLIGTNSDVFTIENLSVGNYVVNVNDASGCTANYQSVITQPLTRVDISSFTITPISLTNAVDGAIAIEAAGGTGPYTYSWTGPNSFTSTTKNISGLRSGTYTIVVKDAKNCLSNPRNFVIENPTPFVFNITSINTPCFGSTLGSITTNPQGGYGGPYNINWFKYNGTAYVVTNDGILDGNDLVLSKIGAGLYKIVVTDSKGISYSLDGIRITEPTQMNLQLVSGSIQPETCFQSKNGAFSVAITGGTTPYTYILNDQNLTNSSNAITGLAFGDYVLTIKDKNGCFSNSLTVFVPGPEEIRITNLADAITPIKCHNSSDGAISINVKGGANSGYTFSWTGPSNFTSTNEDLVGLSNPGTYTVRITDRTYTSCYKDFEFELVKPAELQATVSSVTNNVCFDPPYAGGFSIAITGGTLPYRVNGNLFNTGSVSFSERATGTYSISVNDANNCKAIPLTAQVQGPSSALVISNKVAVNNVCNPTIQDPANASLSFVLNGGTPFQDSVGAYYKVSIVGKENGITRNSNFYLDAAATPKATALFNSLKDDLYTITIIQKNPNVVNQDNGCEIEFDYKLSKSIYYLDKTVQNALCASEQTPSGKLELKGIYGGKPFIDSNNKKFYKYKILKSDGSQLGSDQQVFQGGDLGLADPALPTIVISNLPQGSYSIQFIDDGSGCEILNKVPFEIFKPTPHNLQLVSQSESCNAASNGTATIKIRGGVAPYKVEIVDAVNLTQIKSTSLWFGVFGEETLGASVIMTGLAAGTYKIKLTDSNGCPTISTDSFTIEEFDAFTHSRIITPESCFDAKDGKVVYTLNGGAQPLIVELSNRNVTYKIDEFRSNNSNNGVLVFDNLAPGTYTLTVKDQNSQCIDFSEEVIIPGPSAVVISAEAADIKNISCYDRTDGSIKINVTGGGYPDNTSLTYQYVWKKNGVVINNPSNPLILTNLGEGVYTVRVTPVLGGVVKTDCSVEESYSITKPEQLYLIEELNQHIDVFCNGGATGFYKIYFTGGTAPYSVLSGFNTNQLSEIASNIDEDNFTKSNLVAGTYNIDIKDANGCKFSEGIKPGGGSYGTLPIIITQPAAKLTFEEIVTPVSCKENTATNDGTIEVKVVGGTAPYTVTWSGPIGYSELINNPQTGIFKIKGPAGSYTYTVTDAVNNCGANPGGSPEIKEPAQLTITEVSKSNATEFRKADGKYKFSIVGNLNDATFIDYVTTSKWYQLVNNVEVELTQYPNGTFEVNDLGVGSYRIRTVAKHKAKIATTTYNGSNTTVSNSNSSDIICATFRDFVITQPALLKVTEDVASHVDVKCHGAQTGSITLNIEGGTAPYEVRWSRGLSNGSKVNVGNRTTIDQLSAGDYTIEVIDARGYRFSQTRNPANNDSPYGLLPIRITQPLSSLQITTNVLHETCRESNDGSIEVIVSGGTAPYSITWSQSPTGGFSYLTNDTNGVFKIKGGAGNYRYEVKDKFDECGTIPGAAIEIKEPEVLELQEQLKSNASEFRKADGKYKFRLVGITDSSPFMDASTITPTELKTFYDYVPITNWYKIDGGTEELISALANASESSTLSAGTYRIKTTASHKSRGTTIVYNSTTDTAVTTYPIVTAIQCATFRDFVITQPSLLKVTEDVASHVDVKCHGAQTGSITLNIEGGTAPYEILLTLNGNTRSIIVEGNTKRIDNLVAGDYRIDVRDGYGLPTRYLYSQTRNPLNGDIVFGPLPISISQPNADRKLFIDRTKVTLTNTSCGLNNGKIILNSLATVQDGPEAEKVLSYFWTGPEGWTSNTRNVENLAPGDYTVTIVDQNSCSISTAPFKVLPSVEVLFDVPEYVYLNCKTPTDPAVIAVTNIRGTEVNGQKIEWFKYNETTEIYDPYTDLLASDDRVRSVTSTGTYKVKVATLNPICFTEKIITVIDKGFNLLHRDGGDLIENNVYKDEYQKPLCFNGTGTFEFQIERVDPKPARLFEFFLDAVAITLESDFLIKYGDETANKTGFKLINVPIGAHVLKVKDEFGCESIVNFEIENRSEIRLKSILLEEYVVQKIKCLDEFGTDNKNKAIIDVTNQVIGGVGTYKYKWTGPSNFSSPNSRIEVTKPGRYDLVILDEVDCESTSYSFTITAPERIEIIETFHKNQSCINETGSLGVRITGGTAPYTIEWKNEKQEVISTLFELNNLPLGKVSAVVIDSNGCSSDPQVYEIIDERLIITDIPVPDDSVCLGKAGYIEVKITKNNSGTLKFYYNNIEVNALRDTAEIFRIVIDNPVLGAELKIVNSFGCSESYTYQFGIAVPKLEILKSDGKILGLKERVSENEEIQFNNKSVGTYIREILDFGDGSPKVEISRSDSSSEKRKHTYTESGVYTSQMEIFNEEGCSIIEKRLVFVGKAYQLKFPTSFSPNIRKDGVPEGDNLNDSFRPIFNGFKSGKMTIYSTSGVKLYEESFSNPEYKDTFVLDSWKGWKGENASLTNRTYICIFEGITFEDLQINESTNFYLFK
jgi:hypothetical protein